MNTSVQNPFYQITFLRHGESVGNAEGRFQGQVDFPLTEVGLEQSRQLAERWKAEGMHFERIISSPLLRARQTAEIVAEALKTGLEFDAEWAEVDNGLLGGLTHEEGERVAPRPAVMTPYTRYGRTGESRWEVYLRAGRCVQKLVDNPVSPTLVVAHGGILNMVMYAVLNIPLQVDFTGPYFLFDNTTFATLLYDASRHNWQLAAFDNRSHLNTCVLS